MYSGVGGQWILFEVHLGGESNIALPSTTKNGESRIVPFFGAG
jgi:acyl-CoA hydrolase